MAKVYNLKYSSTKDKMRDMFIAYKWLAELNGALCNSDEHYPKELKHYIELAGMCFKSLLDLEEIKDDDHLRYLKYKRDAKIILANNSFEVLVWPGGWHFSNLYTSATTSEQSIVFNELHSLRNSDCPYINKIELNILLYRLYIVMNTPNRVYYNQMYSFIKSAIDNVVVTAEDRARNLEAHELFSMFLMMRNSNAIEK
ncbi:uncharacterized protein LOC111030122, partial [Myzus persicae]|uniref:uncharacterized protein LOC111030122 n=1 Tax=Myzus persicae TaxID=13164 RepID=UPI000B934DC7